MLSGAGLVATWLASTPAVKLSVNTASAPARDAVRSADAAVDIAQQADRLRAKLQTMTVYEDPSRNPFRFGERIRAARPGAGSAPPEIQAAPVPEVSTPPALTFTLSGIAEDTANGQLVRTAIISTPQDVVLVKEGDVVADQFRVTRIAADSVELTRTTDNSVVHLGLKP